MEKIKPVPKFHAKATRKLLRLWKQFHAFYKIALHLQINVAHVYNQMMHGKEPRNEILREKLGLSRRIYKPRKADTPKQEVRQIPDYLRWWKRLDADIRDVYIKETYEEWSHVKREH